MKVADIVTGLSLLVFSGWVYLKSHEYRQTTIYIYGPNFFPQILAILTMICAVALIINAIRGKALSKKDHIDKKGFFRMVAAIYMCVGYLLLMQVIGFAISTFVFLFSLMLFLQQKGFLVRTMSSLTISLAVWSIFRFFLVIPIPEGIFRYTF